MTCLYGHRWAPRNDWERWVIEAHSHRCPRVHEQMRCADNTVFVPHPNGTLTLLQAMRHIPRGGLHPHAVAWGTTCVGPTALAIEVAWRVGGLHAVLDVVFTLSASPPCPVCPTGFAECGLCSGHRWLDLTWVKAMLDKRARNVVRR